jgi:hypothetical protein
MSTIQERRRALLAEKLDAAIEAREQTITKLCKLEEKTKWLRRQLAHYDKAMARTAEATAAKIAKLRTENPLPPEVVQELTRESAPVPAVASVSAPAVADLDIPDFLNRVEAHARLTGQRTPAEIAAAKAADDAAAAKIKAEQAAHKQAKSRARIDKLKAKQAGDLKRMPPTGRAAL